MHESKTIIISRTDSIGDVILTLPMAGLIKLFFPNYRIVFLGKTYTKDIINYCSHIDEFVDYSIIEKLPITEQINYFKNINADTIIQVFPTSKICKLAKFAEIPTRIGTSHRLYNWLYCNKLIHFSRKNSNLHESELNLKLLEGMGLNILSDGNIRANKIHEFYGMTKIQELPLNLQKLIAKDKFNLILHPKSNGSAKEWTLDNYSELIKLLPNNEYNLIITGTDKEEPFLREFLLLNENRIVNLVGKISLNEFISLINCSDGLVAASTGPLHIASALGKYALGLFSSHKPINPIRWAPIGKNAEVIESNEKKEDKFLKILPLDVFNKINIWKLRNNSLI